MKRRRAESGRGAGSPSGSNGGLSGGGSISTRIGANGSSFIPGGFSSGGERRTSSGRRCLPIRFRRCSRRSNRWPPAFRRPTASSISVPAGGSRPSRSPSAGEAGARSPSSSRGSDGGPFSLWFSGELGLPGVARRCRWEELAAEEGLPWDALSSRALGGQAEWIAGLSPRLSPGARLILFVGEGGAEELPGGSGARRRPASPPPGAGAPPSSGPHRPLKPPFHVERNSGSFHVERFPPSCQNGNSPLENRGALSEVGGSIHRHVQGDCRRQPEGRSR